MVAARDAEDARLLAAGEHGVLLGVYFPVVQARVFTRGRGPDADDVVQDIMTRLLGELTSGKHYSAPFRVVVHNVITWLIGGYFQGQRIVIMPLPDDWEELVGDEGFEIEDWLELERLFADLTEGQRHVAELRYVHGLEIEEIASELGMTRNAVDQALHRVHVKIREKLDG
jgi:RNA polymerase sigma factor (sigma-70 family)